ncbi:hypothetical protein HDU93_006918, partial [Gonapodya sp. JEL0774]
MASSSNVEPFVNTTITGSPPLDPTRSTKALKLTWGRANEFKEGDETIGVAARTEDERAE